MRRLGLIGAGSLAQTVTATLAQTLRRPLDQLSVLCLESAPSLPGAEGLAERLAVRADIEAFLGDAPDLVAECAGHSAVRMYGPAILLSGCDLVVASVGALADDELRGRLEDAAGQSGSQIFLASGAIGALDLLGAARLSGLKSVIYTGRKPPRAWLGTPAERLIDLSRVREATPFFEGSAREAARDYPQNVNVAATLALAGLGFDRTSVRLVADPAAVRNVHEVAVDAGCASFRIAIEGVPSPINPKSSLTAGYSVARQVLNRIAELVI